METDRLTIYEVLSQKERQHLQVISYHAGTIITFKRQLDRYKYRSDLEGYVPFVQVKELLLNSHQAIEHYNLQISSVTNGLGFVLL